MSEVLWLKLLWRAIGSADAQTHSKREAAPQGFATPKDFAKHTLK